MNMANNDYDSVRIPDTTNAELCDDGFSESSIVHSEAQPVKKKGVNLRALFSSFKKTTEPRIPESGSSPSKFGPKPTMLPIIGHLPARTQYLAGGAMVVATLFGAAAAGGFGVSAVSDANQRAGVASTVQMLSQKIASSSESAIQGDSGSITKIRKAASDLSQQMNILLDGDSETGMGGLKSENVDEVIKLEKSTRVLIERAHTILENATALSQLDKNIANVEKNAQSIFESSSQLVSLLSSSGAPRVQVAAAEHIRVLAERVRTNSVVLFQGKSPNRTNSQQIIADYKSINDTLNDVFSTGVGEKSSNELLKNIRSSVAELGSVENFVEENGSKIIRNRTEQNELISLSDAALNDALQLSKRMIDDAENKGMYQVLSGVLLLLSILGVFLVGAINTRITKIESWESRRKNKMNEDDIMVFMRAVMPLEDGDLTLNLTSDTDALEGITGGIRSSVSEAVSSLREAVDTVKVTASSASAAVNRSVDSSTVLDTANQRQSAEIDSIVKNVEGLTSTIEKVTENTLRAAEMTQQAKVASAEAADVVAITNEKMTGSRLKIQEVLKSAKRQGETSHEIGQVAELIENITDMTRVIAVNASLEAAKAGSAGLGFQVLAGEVNRLAEQSNELLVTITALVQRNQGETAATIKSVEEATNSVVEGAQLAEAANEKLREIASISGEVAEFVAAIRKQAEDQSETASDVRNSMGRLAELSQDSQRAVSEVVLSVSEINDSMEMLEKTVATFKTQADD
jgi:twitching motility protein PilJ